MLCFVQAKALIFKKMNRFLSSHPRALAAAVGVVTIVSMFAMTPVAQASSLTSSQVNAIMTLLQAFGADSATIANVQAALMGTSSGTTVQTSTSTPSYNGPGNASSCMSISGTLSVGSRGEDVTRLQQFLAQNKSIYPQGLVTGYYGTETEDAVRRYQALHGIVATGTPSTTGYGIVGPSTRGEMEHEMESECNSGDHSNSTDNASSTPSQEGEHGQATTTSSDSSSGSKDN